MLRVVMASIRVAVEAQRDRIFELAGAALGFGLDVVYLDLHSSEAMADAAVSRSIYQRLVSHIHREWHVSCAV